MYERTRARAHTLCARLDAATRRDARDDATRDDARRRIE